MENKSQRNGTISLIAIAVTALYFSACASTKETPDQKVECTGDVAMMMGMGSGTNGTMSGMGSGNMGTMSGMGSGNMGTMSGMGSGNMGGMGGMGGMGMGTTTVDNAGGTNVAAGPCDPTSKVN